MTQELSSNLGLGSDTWGRFEGWEGLLDQLRCCHLRPNEHCPRVERSKLSLRLPGIVNHPLTRLQYVFALINCKWSLGRDHKG